MPPWWWMLVRTSGGHQCSPDFSAYFIVPLKIAFKKGSNFLNRKLQKSYVIIQITTKINVKLCLKVKTALNKNIWAKGVKRKGEILRRERKPLVVAIVYWWGQTCCFIVWARDEKVYQPNKTHFKVLTELLWVPYVLKLERNWAVIIYVNLQPPQNDKFT